MKRVVLVCLAVVASHAAPVFADDKGDWLTAHLMFAQAPATQSSATCPATMPAGGQATMPYWKLRAGPSQPGHFWPSVKDDIFTAPAQFWDDTKALFTNKTSLALFAAAAVSGAVIAGTDMDDDVEDHFSYDKGHGSQPNTEWDSVGGFGGSPATHFVIAGAWYAAALAWDSPREYERSKKLINSLALTGAITMSLKLAFRTESPNGDEMGWPSGHSSSSFAFATFLYHEYGPWVGVPAYAFATFVACERVDARNHDFSDVVSGAFIGIAVAHAVCRNHEPEILGMKVVPFVHPEGATGLALCKTW